MRPARIVAKLRNRLARRAQMDLTTSYMLTRQYSERFINELAEVAYVFISKRLAHRGTGDQQRMRDIVCAFIEHYGSRPVSDNTGGSGFHNCFWLYVISRYLNPSLIVESGVWKGQSSWILSQACPNATLHSFDLSLRRLVYKNESINFHEMDWRDFEFGSVDPTNSMAFFDCHTNQAKRIREAYAKGFRLLLFDDNAPVHKLYSFGLPPLPTVDMLLDDSVAPGDVIKWKWRGVEKSYIYNEEDECAARELVKQYAVFPDVGTASNYGGFFSFLSFVELVD